MIVAERKTLEEIRKMLEKYNKVLIAGCGTCVAVCLTGGEKEVGILAEQLRMMDEMEGKKREFGETTITRQCDKEYLSELKEKIKDYDAVLSTACGAGVQFLAEYYEGKNVLPALNTRFIGVAEGAGVWTQRCVACSDCILFKTGGICPVTICPKGLVNGPCGGTNHGKCEVDKEKDCAWTLIYRRLEKLGRLNEFLEIHPPKNYKVQTHPGKMSHPAYSQEAKEK